ncbi:MAG: sulfotransferase [Paracoccaceae bacterium]
MADYSTLAKVLHRLALGGLGEMLHDIERARFLKKAPEGSGKNVFVTGLARAGTTILMREIHGTGAFGSLTYADMPFVLAPNTWARLSKKGSKPGKRAERAHGDGIEVDTHSPEALEEVFWRVRDGKAYIKADHLLPHRPDAEAMSDYKDFIRLVLLRTGKTRYLAKNNNNFLRLGTLARAFPMSDVLIPVRDPLQHARSLLDQHKRFLTPDAFTRSYMTWLVHHEFGATHRPFRFGAPAKGDPGGMDYWLRLWIEAHQVMLAVEETLANIRFLPSEAIGQDAAMWRMIARRLEIQAGPLREIRAPKVTAVGAHDAGLAREALGLHARLLERSKLKLA